jgi:acetyl-CoA carboxylase/biotin carboxylase 1
VLNFFCGLHLFIYFIYFIIASELARREGIPRIYVATNSGARIGLAEEVRALFRIAWRVPGDATKGLKYLYLTPADYAKVTTDPKRPAIIAELIEEDGEKRYRVTDIIGQKDGLGVENLKVSLPFRPTTLSPIFNTMLGFGYDRW